MINVYPHIENNYKNKVISIGDTFYNELICRNVKNDKQPMLITILLSPDDNTHFFFE